MLTEQEKAFLRYWEAVRENESRFGRKLQKGLPLSFMFGLPILLSVLLVYWFSPEWFTKISKSLSRVTFTIIFGVILSILFFAFTRMHFTWERNEQLYQELQHRARKNSETEKI